MQPVIIYTTSFCPDCWRVKKVLELLEVPFEERDINLDETAAAEIVALSSGRVRVPTMRFPNGAVLVGPENLSLVRRVLTEDSELS